MLQKILVIDDEIHFRETLRGALSSRGFEAFGADNGTRGVQLARALLPDLIISDVNMEAVDGYDVLRALRNDPLTATIPFILMTGNADELGMRKGMEEGADDYLAKPFTLEAFLAAVEARLKKQKNL